MDLNNIISAISNVPSIFKYASAVLAVLLILVCCLVKHQTSRIETLRNDIVALEYKIKFAENEIKKSKAVIAEQNKSIQQYIIDKDIYFKTIAQKEKELAAVEAVKQNEIANRLNEDSSSDNQLKIIHEILKDFSNARN